MYFHRSFPILATTLLTAFPASAQSITSANTIFMVDESGSMAGEQAFIGNFVLDVDPALSIAGITTRRYGLIGFGGPGTGPAGIREFSIGGSQLGNAADFAAATTGLVTSGSFEDGYAAIDYVLQNFTLPGGSTTFVLITDEDRDNSDATLTATSIRSALDGANINLVTMVNVSIEDGSGNPAISTDGTTALVQSGTTFTSQPLGGITNGAGTTIVDYADLALATGGGCVADLNQLRLGGDAATAFAAAFQTCIINAATNPNITALLTNPYRDTGIFMGLNLRAQLRAMAYWMGYDGPTNPGASTSRNADGIAQDMLGVEGLRGYILGAADTGSVDANGANAAIDYSGRGFTLGADLTMPTDSAGGLARFGVALAFRNSDASTATTATATDATLLSFYGLYRSGGGLQVSGDVQIGMLEHDTVSATGATGSTNSDLQSISVEVGQRFPMAAAVVMPYGGLSRDRFDFDGYTNSVGTSFPSYTETVTTAKLGVRVETQTMTQAGALDAAFDLAVNRILDDTIAVATGATVAGLDPLDETRLDLAVDLGLTLENGGRIYMQLAGSSSENTRSGSLGLGYEMRF